MKQYVGFIRDHSGSMHGLTDRAMKDYNTLIESFQSAAKNSSIDTIVSTVQCGIGPGRGRVERDVVNSNIQVLKPMQYYRADGQSTPLFDSVGDLINLFKEVPDYEDKNVSFLIMAVTDGGDNDSPGWASIIKHEIYELQRTDRWTFVFRVPRGYKQYLTRFGIPEGNIREWDLTEASLRESTEFTEQAVHSYYNLRASGVGSTQNFYTNLNATKEEVRSTLKSIAKEASIYPNTLRPDASIKEVAIHYTGSYEKGTVFYQLLGGRKNIVQVNKLICVQEKNTKNIYSGRAARDLLGLPSDRTVKVSAGDHGNYEIFIQSTSVNRKIPLNAKVLVWKNARAVK